MAEKNNLKASILTISEYSALQKNAVIKLYDKRCVTWKTYKTITVALKKKFRLLLNTLPDVGNNSESYVFIVFKNEEKIVFENNKKFFFCSIVDVMDKFAITERAKSLLGLNNIINEKLFEIWAQETEKTSQKLRFLKALSFVEIVSKISSLFSNKELFSSSQKIKELQKISIDDYIKRNDYADEFEKIQNHLKPSHKTRCYTFRMSRWILTRDIKNELGPDWQSSELKHKYFDDVKLALNQKNNIVCNENDSPILEDPLIKNEFKDIDDLIRVFYPDKKSVPFIFLIVLFHYCHLAEEEINFNLLSVASDIKKLYQINKEIALNILYLIGYYLPGKKIAEFSQSPQLFLLKE